MPKAIYEELRKSIDRVGAGFSKTDSGVELKLLENLFNEEEARIYINLTDKLETLDTIAKRLGADKEKVANILEGMNKKRPRISRPKRGP